MKINKYIVPLLFCTAGVLQGCNDFLDTKPSESYSEELVWSSRSTAEAFILQTYNNVIPKYTDFKTEDCLTTNSVYVYQGSPNAVRELVDRGWDFGFGDFGTVRRCNLIIEKVAASPIDEKSKTELIAEGKMLRAMTYYYQAKHTGRVIWVDRVLTEEDDFNLGLTSTIKESYDYILKDLDDAIAGSLSDGSRLYGRESLVPTSHRCSGRHSRLYIGQQLRRHVQSGRSVFFSGNHSGKIPQQG